MKLIQGTEMNLKLAKGFAVIWNNTEVYTGYTPYLLIDFPTKEKFISLYKPQTRMESREKYWEVLNRRRHGATLDEAGKPYALSRERVRQIEAKFIRLLSHDYWHEVDANIAALAILKPQAESFLESGLL